MDSIKPIIAPVEKSKLEAELTKERFVRNTNKGGNKIYDFKGNEAPNLMNEVGRLREESFRQAGGGTGKEADIDDYDLAEVPYRQLIVWDPVEKEILGGYRYIMGNTIPRDKDGNVKLATSRLFHFSKKFLDEYLPHTIELGRSFVQPQYQSSKQGAKSLFALDNLWDGLGSLIVNHPEMKYFFGKVTMYTHFNQEARDLILSFMNKYFGDPDKLLYPLDEFKVKISLTQERVNEIFKGPTFVEDYKILNRLVRELGESIPPLVNAYMNLSPSMRSFGTAVNDRFGDVEETGIIITINEFNKAKTERHVETYNPNEPHD
ncbi:GNAT family N-acetyltransferase [Plebeiibacterium sediminum]|uniref:GNAT family N-acetyltransferase n=1 Tax=Plebeiibacterium sediminum TaxID=2992112 RepID=A0AAE3M7F5_9BACT|nr:GNAT family N-acetyltransferase [Plebeiobacterium sediminum]MCW3788407.1 GNAT family N-acetyltransferase [Plebeiobacterium sediminum]